MVQKVSAVKELIQSMLKPDRYLHSLNVAKAAVQLAQQYGEDQDKAYISGLLHDVMKNTPAEEQLRLILSSEVQLTVLERANPKLWHAISGAVYMRDVLHIEDEDMFYAVRYHTTGRADMSLLEKIIYVADYISEDRNYNGVESMRKKAFTDLNSAILEGTQFAIMDLAQRELQIHPDTLATYNKMCEICANK